MLAKILVGLVAAMLVTGAGVYYAFSGSCDQHTCPGTSTVTVSEGSSCCSQAAKPSCCDGDHTEEAACSEGKACCADATAAFTGPAALTAKSSCKKACCDE